MIRNTFFIFLFVTCLLKTGLAADLPLKIVHLKGQVTTLTPGDPLHKVSKIGFEYHDNYKIFSSDFSELVLKHQDFIELSLAGLSHLEFLDDQDNKRMLNFAKGHLLLSLKEQNSTLHHIKVPYGQIEFVEGEVFVEVRQNNNAFVYAQTKKMNLTHMRGQKKSLKEGESVIIDRFGFKKPKISPDKARVIFDFSREPSKESIVMKSVAKNQQQQKDDPEKQDDSSSATVRGKVAKDAKIVEGEGDGEGEYKWDLGPNLLFFLLPVLALASLITFFKFRKPKESKNEKNSTSKDSADNNYEAEDVYVVRGNLTSNDGKLSTTKTTHILGDVEDGAEIDATHKLLIKGSFQGAKLISTHNVTIDGGINGMSKANLQVNGDLKTTYISEAHILCTGALKVDQAIRNSKVATEGLIKVQKKDIIGGIVASRTGIECETLGSDFGETEIHLGSDPFVIWKDIFEFETNIEPFKDSQQPELNTKANVKIYSEATNTKLILGNHKLDQKKVLPGPVESHYELSDGGKLTFRGFRRED
jgi:hypothetical protein